MSDLHAIVVHVTNNVPKLERFCTHGINAQEILELFSLGSIVEAHAIFGTPLSGGADDVANDIAGIKKKDGSSLYVCHDLRAMLLCLTERLGYAYEPADYTGIGTKEAYIVRTFEEIVMLSTAKKIFEKMP